MSKKDILRIAVVSITTGLVTSFFGTLAFCLLRH